MASYCLQPNGDSHHLPTAGKLPRARALHCEHAPVPGRAVASTWCPHLNHWTDTELSTPGCSPPSETCGIQVFPTACRNHTISPTNVARWEICAPVLISNHHPCKNISEKHLGQILANTSMRTTECLGNPWLSCFRYDLEVLVSVSWEISTIIVN